MEYGEFHDLTVSTIRGMYDRIPERFHNGFEIAFDVGELGPAIEEVIGGLKRFHVSITPTERDDLARLLRDLDEPETRLDGITVTADRAAAIDAAKTYAEFHELAVSTTNGICQRMPAQDRERLRDLDISGKLDQAVDMLIGELKKLDIPVTPTERDNLARLLRHLGEPENRLDGVAVVSHLRENPTAE